MPRSKRALAVERNDVLRALARSILDEQFEGNQAAMARRMGTITPTMLSDFLNEKRGAGDSVIQGLAKITGKSPATLRGEHVEYEPGEDAALGRVAIGNHRDYAKARAEAIRLYGKTIDMDILAKVESVSLGDPIDVLTAETVKRIHDTIAGVEADRARARAKK